MAYETIHRIAIAAALAIWLLCLGPLFVLLVFCAGRNDIIDWMLCVPCLIWLASFAAFYELIERRLRASLA
jgi:hypothetical protein